MSDNSKTSLYHPDFPKSWDRCKLIEIADWINGNAFGDDDFTEEGLPIIKITEIKEGIRSQTNCTNKSYDEKYKIRDGDLLFAWSGSPETSIDVFRWNGPEGWLNQHIFKIESNDGVNQDFIFYLLKYIKQNLVEIARNNQTTGLGHVRKKDLEQLEVGLPPYSKQLEIVEQLKPLDSKVQVNNRISRLLGEIVETQFKSWFVGFEPYDIFVDSELGEIPENFEVQSLDEVLSFQRGYSYSGDELIDDESDMDIDEGYPMVNLGNIQPGGGYRHKNMKYCKNIPHERYLVKPGDLVISHTDMTQDRKILGSPTVVPDLDKEPILFSHHLYAIKDTDLPKEYLYYYFLSPYFKPKAENFASGTTVLSFSSKITSDVKIPVPPKDKIEEFTKIARPIFEKQEVIRRQNIELEEMRDTLIPRLMSRKVWDENKQESTEVASEV